MGGDKKLKYALLSISNNTNSVGDREKRKSQGRSIERHVYAVLNKVNILDFIKGT